MIFAALRRWFHRDRIAELDRIKLGDIPVVMPPNCYVCEPGEIVHVVAKANAESEMGKPLGAGFLILSNRGMSFIGAKRPIRYTWSQIDSSGVGFAGRGSYTINTKRGRCVDFNFSRRWDAEQIHA